MRSNTSDSWSGAREAASVIMHRGASGCVVPDHREIKIRTLAGILKQASVSREEFPPALNSRAAVRQTSGVRNPAARGG